MSPDAFLRSSHRVASRSVFAAGVLRAAAGGEDSEVLAGGAILPEHPASARTTSAEAAGQKADFMCSKTRVTAAAMTSAPVRCLTPKKPPRNRAGHTLQPMATIWLDAHPVELAALPGYLERRLRRAGGSSAPQIPRRSARQHHAAPLASAAHRPASQPQPGRLCPVRVRARSSGVAAWPSPSRRHSC